MSDFLYQLIPHKIKSGCSLLLPDPVEVKSVYDKRRLDGKPVEFPYWTRIWPSAKVMAGYLMEQPSWIHNKNIAELAAGIGLPSFAVAHLAQTIIVSDGSADAVKLLDINIQSNGLQHVSAAQIDWNNHRQPLPGIETLLLSDVCYDPHQYDGLVQMLKSYKNQGTDILITAPQRISTVPFHQLLSPFLKQTFLKTIDDTEIALFIL